MFIEITVVNANKFEHKLSSVGDWKFQFYDITKTMKRQGEDFELVYKDMALKHAKLRAYQYAREQEIKKALMKISEMS